MQYNKNILIVFGQKKTDLQKLDFLGLTFGGGTILGLIFVVGIGLARGDFQYCFIRA